MFTIHWEEVVYFLGTIIVFRRDEIWFAAMNDNHESEIYSLYEFRQEDNTRVKSTAAFDKQYLEGRYGADQQISSVKFDG